MENNYDKLFTGIASVYNSGFANMLAEKLADMILQGELPPCYVMPNENEMCRLLSVGRSTLREAYKVLDSMGYITRTKSGTVVNDIKELALGGSFNTSLKLSCVDEMIEFITLLEPQAAYHAAERATQEEIKLIEKYMLLCDDYVRDLNKLEEYNRLFHRQIRLASHNCVLISAISASFGAFDNLVVKPVYNPVEDTGKFLEGCIRHHHMLYDAIVSHNAGEAERLSLEHLTNDVMRIKNKISE